MKLPVLWAWLEGPHLEPFEALLDEFADAGVDLMLGPALVLQSGLGAIVALHGIGARCWLDLGIVVDQESAQALGRVLSRSSALGLVVSGRSDSDAIALLVRSAPGRAVLVRVEHDLEDATLQSLLSARVAGCVCMVDDLGRLTAHLERLGGTLPIVAMGCHERVPTLVAPLCGWIVRDLVRGDDPIAMAAALRSQLLGEEVANGA